MTDEQNENDLSMWLSTYGLITVERILERYKIRLAQEDLLSALKTPGTFYHQLLSLPLRNVFNGIIFQQVRDYQIYAQKLFIDYLLSGESGKSEDAPGGLTRINLEEERLQLVALGENFHQQELNQEKIIAESQAMLIKHAGDWQIALLQVAHEINSTLNLHMTKEKVAQSITTLLVQYSFHDQALLSNAENWSKIEANLGQVLTPEQRAFFITKLEDLNNFNRESDASTAAFSARISDMNNSLKRFRKELHELIIRVSDMLKQLPEYRIDNTQSEINRQDLYFDSDIGS